MSDHKAEAEDIMANLAAPASDPHGAALVHATLYLAEQQRIANKLAVASIEQLGSLAQASAPPMYGQDPAVDVLRALTPDEWKGLDL